MLLRPHTRPAVVILLLYLLVSRKLARGIASHSLAPKISRRDPQAKSAYNNLWKPFKFDESRLYQFSVTASILVVRRLRKVLAH